MSSKLKAIDCTIARSSRGKFTLNGKKERILSIPKSRDGQVKFTMGGKVDFAESLPVKEFEEVTGHYIVGLEPSFDYNKKELLTSLKSKLNDMNFNSKSDDGILTFNMEFATSKNVHANVTMSIVELAESDRVKVYVAKKAGYANVKREEFEGPASSMPVLLFNGVEKLFEFSSTAVQILSSDKERGNRCYYKDGTPELFFNESIDEYFESSSLPAGIVRNNNGKYQAFYSYQIYQGHGDDLNGCEHKRSLHHDVNEYKTLKAATKALGEKGFGPDGRYNKELDLEQVKSDFHNYRHSGSVFGSWSDDVLGYFSTESGHGEASNPRLVHDDDLGNLYSVDFSYTDEKTGRQFNRTITVNPEPDSILNNLHGFSLNYLSYIKGIYEKKAGCEFDKDTRSNAEKEAYHRDRFKVAVEYFKQCTERLNEAKDEWSQNHARERLSEVSDVMAHHREQFLKFVLDTEDDVSFEC